MPMMIVLYRANNLLLSKGILLMEHSGPPQGSQMKEDRKVV